MEFKFSPEDELFREEVRDWLETNKPRDRHPPLEDPKAYRDYDLAWQRKQYDGGWAGIAWPVEYGGRGLSLVRQVIWHEEYARAEAPSSRNSTYIALNHGGPTIFARGNEEQKAFHLPKILKGEAIWCQGFSEPNAGSDLANLQTRGVVDGDHLVVNGSKIWTTFGHLADYQELLVRTQTGSKKHAGITWIIGDMRLPGIDVRPLRTMVGKSRFCQVFYDNVRIPLANVVGELHQGWSVTLATLGFERGTAAMGHQIEMESFVERLIAAAKDLPSPSGSGRAIDDDLVVSRLATLRAEVAAMRAMTYTSVSRAARQSVPGPEGSMIRLYHTELVQRIMRMAFDLLGETALDRSTKYDWLYNYLESYSRTIAGGTSEIQRNTIGERLLGLPR